MVHKAVVTMAGASKYVVVQVFSIFLGIGAFIIFTVLDSDILGQQWKWLCVINALPAATLYAAAIVLYEALRQLSFRSLQSFGKMKTE